MKKRRESIVSKHMYIYIYRFVRNRNGWGMKSGHTHAYNGMSSIIQNMRITRDGEENGNRRK